MVDAFMSESELRHWLSIEDWYMSSHLREWMQRIPRSQAADILARIAQDADLEPNTPWAAVAMAFIITGFTPSSAIAGNKLNDRRAGIRAALHLADLNDTRALVPLTRLWVGGGWRQSKYHEQIEGSLTRLLGLAAEHAEQPVAPDVVRALACDVWRSCPTHQELPSGRTSLVLSALHYLQNTNLDENATMLQDMLAKPAKRPNRQQIQAMVQRLLATTASSAV